MLTDRNREMCSEITNVLTGGCSMWDNGKTSVRCDHEGRTSKAVVLYGGNIISVIGRDTLTITTHGIRNNVLASRINAIFKTFGLPEMSSWKINGEDIVDGEPYMIPKDNRYSEDDDEDDDDEDDYDDGDDDSDWYDDYDEES